MSAHNTHNVAQLLARIAELETQLAATQKDQAGAPATHASSPVGIEQLWAVFHNYHGGMCFSREGIIIDANAELARMLRLSLDQVIGRPILDFIAPEDQATVRERIAAGRTESHEHHVIRADGVKIPLEVTSSVVKAEGPPLRFSVLRDISERRKASQELDRERRTLQAIVDNIPVGVYVAEAGTFRPILSNKRIVELFRSAGQEPVDPQQVASEFSVYLRGTDNLYPTERMPLFRAMAGESSVVDDMEVHHVDGSRTLLQVQGAPIRDAEGNIVMSVVISQDITASKQAEQVILNEQKFLRSLIKAHERDRQLMAYDVHDGLVQYIIGAVWVLESLEQDASLSAEAKKSLAYSEDLLRKAIADARRILSGLRPPVLDEKGILVAIEYLAAEAAEASELQVQFTHDVQFRRLEPFLEGTIFRIVQESLSNVRKHSSATHVDIRLEQRGERIVLTVHDNGVGFDSGQVSSDSFGLQGIRKRAELASGMVNIKTCRGEGTTLTIDLPYVPAAGEPQSD